MSGIIFLSANDFFLEKGSKSTNLCHRIPGVSLVMFYADRCDGCQSIKPHYQKLPRVINSCRFKNFIYQNYNKNL